MTRFNQVCDKNRHIGINVYLLSVSILTTPVLRKLKTSCVESMECQGHQHVVHCVAGHIVAVETLSRPVRSLIWFETKPQNRHLFC